MHNALMLPETCKHHEAFSKFRALSGPTTSGIHADFLGSTYRTSFSDTPSTEAKDLVAPPYPAFDEEYFEWIDLLEALLLAKDRFTMIELGAGFGRWTARAAAAARQRSLTYRFVVVEAEPTHFQWLRQNLLDNGIDLASCTLIHAAVTGRDGRICFEVGAPGSYGQAIGGNTVIDAISLATLLNPLDLVDLIDMDVQGAELDVLAAAVEPLQKVKRVHVETHGDLLHADVLRYFRSLGWQPHFLYEGDTGDITPWGRINFQGGTQSWLNPRLHTRSELRSTPLLQNSLGRRTLAAGRQMLNYVAPIGTARRRACAALMSPFLLKYRRDRADAAQRPMIWRQPTAGSR
jgi:FkbM family methyltransferase